MKKITYLLAYLLLAATALPGQRPAGPAQDSVWTTLRHLLNEETVNADDQLKTLLEYRQRLENQAAGHDSTYASLLAGISKLFESKQEFNTAILYMQQAIQWLHANAGKPSVKPIYLAVYYYELAWYYDALNLTADKMKAFDNCIVKGQELGLTNEFYYYALLQRVKYLFDRGDFARCADYAGIGKAAAGRSDPGNYESIFRHHEINAWMSLKDHNMAETLIREAEKNIKHLSKHTAALYQQKASLEMDRGNYTATVGYYATALKFLQTKNDSLQSLQVCLNLGYYFYYLHNHDYPTALQWYRKALSYKSKKTDIPSSQEALEVLNLLTNIANVYTRLSQFDSAFQYYQRAFDQLEPGTNETRLNSLALDSMTGYNRMFYVTALFIDKGDAYLKKFQATRTVVTLSEAIRIYKAADQLLDRIKSEQFEIASRLTWRNDSRRLYEHAIEACRLSNNMTDAFYFFEKSRAVLLNDELHQLHLLSKSDFFKKAQLEKMIRQGKTAKQYLALKQELDQLKQKAKTHNPLYYQGFFDTAFIKLADVQKTILKDHQLLLEILEGDSAVYTLHITPAAVHLEKIDKQAYDSLSRSYMGYLSDPNLLNTNYSNFITTANRLYTLLFQKYPAATGRMIIIPDGHYMPFESLITSTGSNPVYFFQQHATSYSYSARYLLNSTPPDTKVPGNFLGVAPVQYAARLSLPALAGSDASLNNINTYFQHTHNLVQSQATRKNFMRLFPRYTIIQLYTHASDSSAENGEPVIYFNDSALYLTDLISEDKPVAQLIVLSACETGKGKLFTGEGVFSFNREFAALGIPSSLINLWTVDNTATYRLTELFHKYVSEGLPVDVALQQARIEFVQTASGEKILPYFWASTILSGTSNPIEYTQPISRKWYVFAAAGALIVLAGWYIYLRRN